MQKIQLIKTVVETLTNIVFIPLGHLATNSLHRLSEFFSLIADTTTHISRLLRHGKGWVILNPQQQGRVQSWSSYFVLPVCVYLWTIATSLSAISLVTWMPFTHSRPFRNFPNPPVCRIFLIDGLVCFEEMEAYDCVLCGKVRKIPLLELSRRSNAWRRVLQASSFTSPSCWY